jgi:mono/diheme cytochrome c family protein
MESEMTKKWIFAAILVCVGGAANAQTSGDASRGELLYTTYCIACHNVKIHWRDKKDARDWTSLNSEVNRWQGISGLAWSDDDIAEVARYLNILYYHYPDQVK